MAIGPSAGDRGETAARNRRPPDRPPRSLRREITRNTRSQLQERARGPTRTGESDHERRSSMPTQAGRQLEQTQSRPCCISSWLVPLHSGSNKPSEPPRAGPNLKPVCGRADEDSLRRPARRRRETPTEPVPVDRHPTAATAEEALRPRHPATSIGMKADTPPAFNQFSRVGESPDPRIVEIPGLRPG